MYIHLPSPLPLPLPARSPSPPARYATVNMGGVGSSGGSGGGRGGGGLGSISESEATEAAEATGSDPTAGDASLAAESEDTVGGMGMDWGGLYKFPIQMHYRFA